MFPPLMLARVPVIPSGPEIILRTVDTPHHPPVPLHHGDIGNLLDCVLRASQALSIRGQVRQTTVISHALEKVEECLIINTQGHLALKLALGLVWSALTISHALELKIQEF